MREAVDFDDEDQVLAEMSKALDIDPDELKIRDDRSGFSVQAYEITIKGGKKEWKVVASEDDERELALEIVKQDLEKEPEIFNKDFIESHIDMDRLKSELHSDVLDMRIDDLTEMDTDDFWKEWEREGNNLPEDVYEENEDEDEQGDAREPTHSEIEELAQSQADDQLKDPMDYLSDIYGREDAVKKAIEIAGIDIDAAAEDAVDTDGAAHFLSSYDGHSTTTKSGLVYWRTN
jgi:hypothetical protein